MACPSSRYERSKFFVVVAEQQPIAFLDSIFVENPRLKTDLSLISPVPNNR